MLPRWSREILSRRRWRFHHLKRCAAQCIDGRALPDQRWMYAPWARAPQDAVELENADLLHEASIRTSSADVWLRDNEAADLPPMRWAGRLRGWWVRLGDLAGWRRRTRR